ncbi:MAG: hypothetical protein PHS57_05965 [Alphaproteobacteria bacterium]|nr:hypothetical protein [Alphaproteobacteria bacterium]
MIDTNARSKLDAAFALKMKFNGLPRAGWVVAGSRARTNHTILVSREEVKQLADDLYAALHGQHTFMYEAGNLRGYLEQIAEGEHGAMRCKRCFRTYREGWMNGKCPYCEAEKAAASMLSTAEASK